MPSKYEPCGLNQMYSLKYGTVPIVRETGGLADTIVGYGGVHAESSAANGFSFLEYSPCAERDPPPRVRSVPITTGRVEEACRDRHDARLVLGPQCAEVCGVV